MLPVVATAVFLLVTVGVYLLLHHSLLRVALGLGCLSHGVHLLLLSAARPGAHAPIVTPGLQATDVTDPLPQAFVLTAIVISMALTLYLLAGMARLAQQGGDPEMRAAPESDAERPAEEIRAELEEGRAGS